jgi:capsular exopolysaccharide synthesis family protein
VQDDPEWQDSREQLRSLESAALDDERLGRGPEHPDVRGRSERKEMYQAALALREAELRDLYKLALRHSLEAERLDADITAKVLQETLNEFMNQRRQVSHRAFLLEDVRHERERLEHALTQVRQKVWNVEVEQNRMARVTVDSMAHAPETPNIDKRLKYTAAACLLSLFLGAGAALMRHRLDTSVHDPVEVTKQLGMFVLGSVQHVPETNGISLVHDDRVLEPMRGISTALLSSPRIGHTRSRLITSPTAGSGKSSLALSLAQSLAATGRQVLLVDADNRGQGVTRALGMTGHPGLRELLEGTHRPEDVLHTGDAENLKIVPAGKRACQFGEILGRERAQGNLRSLYEAYDEVVFDSPPVLASSDAVVLATLVNEVILVLRAGRSTREEARAAREHLTTVRAKLVGVILNAVDPKRSRYSYYGYAYADNYGSGDT